MSKLRSRRAPPVAVWACWLALSACKRVPTRNDAPAAIPPTSAAAPAAAHPAASSATDTAIYEFAASDDSTLKLVATDEAGKHEVHLRAFKGRMVVPHGRIRQAHLSMDIDITSLQVDEEKLRPRLKSAQASGTNADPHGRFVSTAVESGGEQGATNTVKGDLVLHGVSRAIAIPSTIHLRGDGVDLDGEFTLSRKAFGLTLPAKADRSVKDEIVVSVTIAATRVAGNAPPE